MKGVAPRIRLPGENFVIQPAGDHFVVIDRKSGRPMSDLLSSLEAGRFRDKLNTAAYCGRASLNVALGASADYQ